MSRCLCDRPTVDEHVGQVDVSEDFELGSATALDPAQNLICLVYELFPLAELRVKRFERLPDSETLSEIGYWSVLVGFPLLTLGIALGAYWANSAWGRYWGWDPKETAALVTWLIYAVYLHARNLKGWSGRPAALILVIGFGAVLFTYFGNLYFSGLHSYSGL